MKKIDSLVWVKGVAIKHTRKQIHVWHADKLGIKRVAHLPREAIHEVEAVDKNCRFLVPQHWAYKFKMVHEES